MNVLTLPSNIVLWSTRNICHLCVKLCILIFIVFLCFMVSKQDFLKNGFDYLRESSPEWARKMEMLLTVTIISKAVWKLQCTIKRNCLNYIINFFWRKAWNKGDKRVWQQAIFYFKFAFYHSDLKSQVCSHLNFKHPAKEKCWLIQ